MSWWDDFIHGASDAPQMADVQKQQDLANALEDHHGSYPSGTMRGLMRSLGFLPTFWNETSGAATTGGSSPILSNPAEAVYKQPIEQEQLAPPPSAPSRDAGDDDALANVRQESPAAAPAPAPAPVPAPAPAPVPRIPRVNEGLNEAVPQADVDAAAYNRNLAENARGPEHPSREIPALIQGSPTAVADAADKFRELAMSAPGAVSTAFAKLTEQVVATGGDMDQVFARIWSSPTIQQLGPNLKTLLSNVWNDYKAAHPLRDTSRSVYTQKQQPVLPPNVGGL